MDTFSYIWDQNEDNVRKEIPKEGLSTGMWVEQ